jgi:hypothetical protein
VERYTLLWQSTQEALLDVGSKVDIDLVVKPPAKAKPRPEPPIPGAIADGHADDVGDDDDVDDVDWLRDLLEAELELDVQEDMDATPGESDFEPRDLPLDEDGFAEIPEDHQDHPEDHAGAGAPPDADISDGGAGSAGGPPPRLPVGPLALSIAYDRVRLDVEEAIKQSKELLALAREFALAAGFAAVDRPTNHSISLIEHDGQVMWAYWTDSSAWEMRPLTVQGSDHFIQAIVPHRVIKRQVIGCRIIVGKVPATMRMRRQSYADKVPEWCMTLFKHASAQFFSGPLDPDDPLTSSCVVCLEGSESGVRSAPADWELHRCVDCTTVWHRECARAYKASLSWTAFDSGSFQCPLCM